MHLVERRILVTVFGVAMAPPARRTVARFPDYGQQHDRVWLSRRIDIADRWRKLYAANTQVKRDRS